MDESEVEALKPGPPDFDFGDWHVPAPPQEDMPRCDASEAFEPIPKKPGDDWRAAAGLNPKTGMPETRLTRKAIAKLIRGGDPIPVELRERVAGIIDGSIKQKRGAKRTANHVMGELEACEQAVPRVKQWRTYFIAIGIRYATGEDPLKKALKQGVQEIQEHWGISVSEQKLEKCMYPRKSRKKEY